MACESSDNDFTIEDLSTTEDSDSCTDVTNIRSWQLEDSKNDTNVPDLASVPSGLWFDPVGVTTNVKPFVSLFGVKTAIIESLPLAKPGDFYQLLVTDHMFETIANETNQYADQMRQGKVLGTSSRLNAWSATNMNEIKRFFGLVIWMGLVKLPSLSLYWSNDIAYKQTFPQRVMSRNRFEILLQMLHFTQNSTADPEDRLAKVHNIVDELNDKFKKYYDPEEYVYVDESMIPLEGRISSQQYMKQKRHKQSLKILKLCTSSGYIYSFHIHCGNKSRMTESAPTNIVMSLSRSILRKGHTICTKDYYTSLDLANELLSEDTHLVGIVRTNYQDLPKEVIAVKLNDGEIAAQQNVNGVTVLKWRDSCDVLMLSTKHSIDYVVVRNRRGNEVEKPVMVHDYNKGKAAVDLSNRMAAYWCPLRKTLKLYRKIALELLLNISVVNARVLYQEVTKNEKTIVEFRKEVALYLISCAELNEPTTSITTQRRTCHELLKKEGQARKVRRYCVRCYKLNAKFGRTFAKNRTNRVVTYCGGCDGLPFYCLPCFNTEHRHLYV